MADQNNKLYFPLFYKYAELFSAMSREELGEIVYAILISRGSMPPKEPLEGKLEVIYGLLSEEAVTLFEKNIRRPNGGREPRSYEKKTPKKERYGDFDPNEAFKLALARSYKDFE